MKKHIFLCLFLILCSVLANNSVFAQSFRYDSATNTTVINGKKYTGATYSSKLISSLRNCQRYQQMDFGGYAAYQVLGMQGGKCIYKSLSNPAAMGFESRWIVQMNCRFNQQQRNEYADAMQNPTGNVAKRTIPLSGGGTMSVTSSYFDYLNQKYSMDGTCK